MVTSPSIKCVWVSYTVSFKYMSSVGNLPRNALYGLNLFAKLWKVDTVWMFVVIFRRWRFCSGTSETWIFGPLCAPNSLFFCSIRNKKKKKKNVIQSVYDCYLIGWCIWWSAMGFRLLLCNGSHKSTKFVSLWRLESCWTISRAIFCEIIYHRVLFNRLSKAFEWNNFFCRIFQSRWSRTASCCSMSSNCQSYTASIATNKIK